MPLWKNDGLVGGAPKFSVGAGLKDIAIANNTVPGTVNCQTAFQNTSTSVYQTGQKVGVFSVTAAESANTQGEGRKVSHAGWVKRTAGTGYIQEITVANGGAGYNSNAWIVFSGNAGGNGANALAISNGSNITSVILINRGNDFNAAPTLAANLSNTSQATFTVVMGGRVGRVHYETLVAMGSMEAGANTDNAYFPE